ncbi:unnamed protein product [Blepharisma stoltei]|uniref:Casein kinase I n=1 Tax=Blepharisma stoltei TaxID=1481888 RepID=A0AAU9JJ96_9CILI|nr:unnamed protein product [Blepharisma stoltei]
MNNLFCVNDTYNMIRHLGSGSFGLVYLGVSKDTQEEVAIKLEPLFCEHAQLENEIEALRDCAGKGIPSVIWNGFQNTYKILVMENLGSNLENIVQNSRKFSLESAVEISSQILHRLEHVHKCGYIHRDIKPENFMMGAKENTSRVYMIDFGLAKKYINSYQKHIAYKDGLNVMGTLRFLSINTHHGIEQSRRDDLESFVYLMIYLIKGKLPWQKLNCKTKVEMFQRVCQMKENMPTSDICKDCPGEVKDMLDYVKALKFDENPDYSFLRNLVRNIKGNIKQKLSIDKSMGLRTKSLRTMNRRHSKKSTKKVTAIISMTSEDKKSPLAFDDESTCILTQKWPVITDRKKLKALLGLKEEARK